MAEDRQVLVVVNMTADSVVLHRLVEARGALAALNPQLGQMLHASARRSSRPTARRPLARTLFMPVRHHELLLPLKAFTAAVAAWTFRVSLAHLRQL